jgi:hypothetical protein
MLSAFPSTGNPVKRFPPEDKKNSHQSAVSDGTENRTMAGIFELAAGEGFEPSHTESESAVLPLHKPAISVRLSEQILLYRKERFCQEHFSAF